MAINYASKYAQKIDEKFARESMTSAAVNNDYDFVGVKTVNVYSVPTAEMDDYSVSGTSRYGTPQEIENTVQEMTMTRDRSFTFTIDRGTYNDTQMSNAAGAALQRQIREVVVPEIDKYRFGKICEGAKTTVTGKVTKANAYDAFLTGATTLIENNVPLVGSCAFVSSDFYKNIKEDSSFIRNQAATTSPVKLSEYKIHDNPPGINGWLVEGRVYYDAFVLENKKSAIYVFKTAE